MEAKRQADRRRYERRKQLWTDNPPVSEKKQMTQAKREEICKKLGIPVFLEPYYRYNKCTISLIVEDEQGLFDLCKLICAHKEDFDANEAAC